MTPTTIETAPRNTTVTRRASAVILAALAGVAFARSIYALSIAPSDGVDMDLRRPRRLAQELSSQQAISTSGSATPSPNDPNQIEVRLAPGLGNEWCVYNGQLGEVARDRVGIATISHVMNSTDRGIVVIHWDTSGGRKGPVSVIAKAMTTAFNGMSVSGVWEAHVAGSENDAPQRVTLLVNFNSV